jgi:hypothetical protein
MTNNRKPAGRPDGGEFTWNDRDEADVELMPFTLDDIYLSTLGEDDAWITDEQWEINEKARIDGLFEQAEGKMFPLAGEKAFEGASGRPEIRGEMSLVNTSQLGPEQSGPFLYLPGYTARSLAPIVVWHIELPESAL